jgi:hypothetical protein
MKVRGTMLSALCVVVVVAACSARKTQVADSQAGAPSDSVVVRSTVANTLAVAARHGPSGATKLKPPPGRLFVSSDSLMNMDQPKILDGKKLTRIVPAPLYVINGVPLTVPEAQHVIDSIGLSHYSIGSTWPNSFASPEARQYWLEVSGFSKYPASANGVIEIQLNGPTQRQAADPVHSMEQVRRGLGIVGGKFRLIAVSPAPLYLIDGVRATYVQAAHLIDSTNSKGVEVSETWPDEATTPAIYRAMLRPRTLANDPAAANGLVELTTHKPPR